MKFKISRLHRTRSLPRKDATSNICQSIRMTVLITKIYFFNSWTAQGFNIGVYVNICFLDAKQEPFKLKVKIMGTKLYRIVKKIPIFQFPVYLAAVKNIPKLQRENCQIIVQYIFGVNKRNKYEYESFSLLATNYEV